MGEVVLYLLRINTKNHFLLSIFTTIGFRLSLGESKKLKEKLKLTEKLIVAKLAMEAKTGDTHSAVWFL